MLKDKKNLTLNTRSGLRHVAGSAAFSVSFLPWHMKCQHNESAINYPTSSLRTHVYWVSWSILYRHFTQYEKLPLAFPATGFSVLRNR